MCVGYIRVGTVDQNTVRQLDEIEVERVFTDKASGKDTARPQLDELIAFVRAGDTVLVHSMDRLARNLDDLRRLVRTLTGKGVRVEFVKESLVFTDEDSPMATLLLSVMGAFAEFERALILERQREGITAAKHRGVYTGRNPPSPPSRHSDYANAPPPANANLCLPGSSGSAARRFTATCAPPPSPVDRLAAVRPRGRSGTSRSAPSCTGAQVCWVRLAVACAVVVARRAQRSRCALVGPVSPRRR